MRPPLSTHTVRDPHARSRHTLFRRAYTYTHRHPHTARPVTPRTQPRCGAHTTLSNNIIGANANGVLVRSGVSDFIIQGNHVGNIFKGSGSISQKHGVEIEAGSSDRYVVSSNTLTGNQGAGLLDGGTGSNKAVANNVLDGKNRP